VDALLGIDESKVPAHRLSATLDEAILRRRDFLTAYQDATYAARYLKLVEDTRRREAQNAPDSTALADAVARNYFKLLAYKDEYEVARLFADPQFQGSLSASFEGDYRLSFHITLPWSRGANPGDEPKKFRFGPWLLPVMKLLARFKFLRGTAFNPFGRIAERRQERELIEDYERTVAHLLDQLDPGNLDAAIALACIPEYIRGYGPVKERAIVQARAQHQKAMAAFDQARALLTKVA
jgi:indolepyruvate ferredoxin oxidoreductase